MPKKRIHEQDERPDRRNPSRSKRKAIAVRKKTPPVYIIGAAMVVFLVLVGIGAIAYFSGRETGKRPDLELLAHAPVDAVVLGGYDLEELGRHEGCRRAIGNRAPLDLVQLERAGYKTADLSRVLFARTANNGATCALRFKSDPNPANYLHGPASEKNYSAAVSSEGIYRYGYFVDSKTLILAEKEPAIQALREKGKGKITSDLQAMVDVVRGPVWVTCGRLSADNATRLLMTEEGFSFRVGGYRGSAIWMEPDGRSATVRMEFDFESPNRATTGRSTLEGLFQIEKNFHERNAREGIDPSDSSDIRRGYDGADISTSGHRVSAKLALPPGEAFWAVGPVRY